MIDFIDVVSTIAFFALMITFDHGLERLGEDGSADGQGRS
jgi:hypothetical protein